MLSTFISATPSGNRRRVLLGGPVEAVLAMVQLCREENEGGIGEWIRCCTALFQLYSG
jgi:hypothetical protein